MGDPAPVHNLADLVTRAARRAGSRCAFVAGADRPLWSEFDARVTRLAAGLIGLGLRPGERVALLLGNSLDFPLCYFAALRAGLVVVPVNTGYTEREAGHLLTDSGAAALVTTGGHASLAGPRLVLIAGAGELSAGTRRLAEVGSWTGRFPARGGEDLAVLMYTSGTSGTPKGAMLSHRALLANLAQIDRIEPAPVTAEDVVLLVLPLFHIYGLNPGLGMVAWAGATGVLAERFDPAGTLALMADEGVSTLAGAPPMYQAWVAGDPAALRAGFANVRLALSGAAPLPADVLAAMADRAGAAIYEGYGLTETAPVLTSTLMSGRPTPGSIGRPLPGVELALWDDEGDPLDEDDDDTGQIAVRGENLFSGYWPDGHDGPDEQGWWPTGDIAALDEEGDLRLVDRLTDLILVSGFNVYPREIEQVLLTHPGVLEAAAVGIADEATGRRVTALVVPTPGEAPSATELMAHCARSLARFKCPVRVEFVGELPHSVTGKLSRARLRELGLSG